MKVATILFLVLLLVGCGSPSADSDIQSGSITTEEDESWNEAKPELKPPTNIDQTGSADNLSGKREQEDTVIETTEEKKPVAKYQVQKILGTIIDPALDSNKSLESGDEFGKDAQLKFEEGSMMYVIDVGKNGFRVSKKNNEVKWEEINAVSATFETYTEYIFQRVTIRFPSGSVQKEYNEEVEDRLDGLIEEQKKNSGKTFLTFDREERFGSLSFHLIGHTDNMEEDNDTLGLKRANQIKMELVQKGVSETQISVSSEGKDKPVASNDTEEGRHDNQRVEVILMGNKMVITYGPRTWPPMKQ